MIALALVALLQEPAADARAEARALLADVRAWLADGELPPAEELETLRTLTAELSAAGSNPDLRELVRELGNLGHHLSRSGRRAEGSGLVGWTVEQAGAQGDAATEAWACDWLGQEAWIHGELDEAAEWLARAAEVDHRRRAFGAEAEDLADVARIRWTQGRLEESQAAAREAWRVAGASDSPAAKRVAAEILASLRFEVGQHREALELCRTARGAADEAPDESRVRLEILTSDILADVGRLEAATAHARAAHELALDARVLRTAPLLHLEAKLSLGLLLGDLGRCDEALEHLDSAATEFERLGDARGAAWSAKNRGFALFAARRLEEAVSAFEEARVAGARLGVPFLEGIGALGAAEALALDEAAEDEPELARIEDALTAAERVTAALDDRTLAWRCAALRGRLLLDRGRPAEALPELSKAVHLIERWRRRLGASGLVEHALRQRSDPYRDAALASAQLGRLDEALTFAARLQSRVLDELRARRDGPIPTPASPELDALRAEVAQRAAAGTPLEREEAEAELDAGLVAAELASGRRLVSPDERLEVTELERGLAAHGLDLALTYLVGERDTLVLRLAVGGTPALAARVLPVGRARCEGWVRTLREPIERLEAEEVDLAHLGFDVPAARAMFDALVRPLDVPPGARVALALDEVLAPVPFEILVTGGTTGPVDFGRPFAHLAGLHFLGDEHELVLLGSLARLLEPLPERSGPTVILAAPPQAGPTLATAEARELEELIPGARVVLETRASAVGELVRGAARVHVAAHGRFDGDSPAHGHLVLGGEESGATARLESWQLAELDLSGAEVVLSSCHAARGAWRAGAGLAGLLRGFFLAGAREVVASPWAVDDRVTLRFMTLYHAARTRGEPAPAALRTARLALRAASDARGFALAHPTFWAWSLYR